MARRLLINALALVTALFGVVFIATPANSADPVVMPTEVRIQSVQSVSGNRPPVRGTTIQIIGQVMAMPESEGPMSNVPGNRGSVTITRQLVGESAFTPMATVTLAAYGRFVVNMPAVRNASYRVSYTGWLENRDPAMLEPIGCDTPCDRMANYLPSTSAVAFGGVTREMNIGRPVGVGPVPRLFWNRVQRPQRVGLAARRRQLGHQLVDQLLAVGRQARDVDAGHRRAVEGLRRRVGGGDDRAGIGLGLALVLVAGGAGEEPEGQGREQRSGEVSLDDPRRLHRPVVAAGDVPCKPRVAPRARPPANGPCAGRDEAIARGRLDRSRHGGYKTC